MDKTVATIEPMSVGQAGNMADQLITYCRKHGATLPKDAVQEVLKEEGEELAKEQFEALRKRAERRSKMIVRRVKVNRDQTPQQLIDATGRKQYIDSKVLATMPRQGTGTEEVDVYFFPAESFKSIDEWDRELAEAGLEPDYYAQAQVNIDDPAFADEHPNGAQWDNDGKKASFVAFDRDDGERLVGSRRNDVDWFGAYWRAGRRVRK